MKALWKLLRLWWGAVRNPSRIRGGEFSTGFMLAVMFYLGLLYNTFHYFLYRGYIIEEFHAGLEFWLHSLYGGTSGVASFLMAGVGGYLGLRLLGKRVRYRRWEGQLFSLSFLFLLPLLLGALFLLAGFTGPLGGVVFWSLPLLGPRASCVVVTLVLGTLLFLRLFRSMGLGWRGLAVMALAVPGFYFLLEKAFFLLVEKVLFPLGFVSGSAQYSAGILWGSLQASVAYWLRGVVSQG